MKYIANVASVVVLEVAGAFGVGLLNPPAANAPGIQPDKVRGKWK